MENQKQKKSVGTILLVILLLIVTIASLVLATYAWAKYTTQTDGTATAEVAKWNVKVDIKEGTNELEEKFEHVFEKRLAPGMSGSFEIDIDPGDTEVDFHYQILLDKVVVVNEDGSEDATKEVPEHLHFYTSSTHGKEDLIGKIEGSGDDKQENGSNAGKYLEGDVILLNSDGSKLSTPTPGTDQPAFDFDGDKIKKVIYWEWPYENTSETADSQSIKTDGDKLTLTPSPNGISDYDDQDTIDGMNAYKVKVQFRVITKQLNPTKN